MFEFLWKFLVGGFVGICGALLFHFLIEGGFAIRGSDKYKKYHKDANVHVKDKMKNGSGSSKEELQDWWDTYHK